MAGNDAFGVKLKIHDGADPGAFEDVGEVTSVNPLDVSVNEIDVTSHDSPDQWAEFLGGIKDGGTISGDINWDAALHGDFLTVVGQARQFQIELPESVDSMIVQFGGFISGYTVDAPHDDKFEGNISIKVSGKPELVAGP